MGFLSNHFLPPSMKDSVLLGTCVCYAWLIGDAENIRTSLFAELHGCGMERGILLTDGLLKLYVILSQTKLCHNWKYYLWRMYLGLNSIIQFYWSLTSALPPLKLKPAVGQYSCSSFGWLGSQAVCIFHHPGRHQQLPLTSVLIFMLANRQRQHFQRWHFSLGDSCGVAGNNGPERRRCSQPGGEQGRVAVLWLKCQLTALLPCVWTVKD